LGDRVLPALLLDMLLVLALARGVSHGVLLGVTGRLPGSAFTAASSPSTTSGFCLAFNSEIAAPMFKPMPALRPWLDLLPGVEDDAENGVDSLP
jgi:hypothetical protein